MSFSRRPGQSEEKFIDEWLRRLEIIQEDDMCYDSIKKPSQQSLQLLRALNLEPRIHQKVMEDLKLGTKGEMKKLRIHDLREKILRCITIPHLAQQRGPPPAGPVTGLASAESPDWSYYEDAYHSRSTDDGWEEWFPPEGEDAYFTNNEPWIEFEDMFDEEFGFCSEGHLMYHDHCEAYMPTFWSAARNDYVIHDGVGFLARKRFPAAAGASEKILGRKYQSF